MHSQPEQSSHSPPTALPIPGVENRSRSPDSHFPPSSRLQQRPEQAALCPLRAPLPALQGHNRPAAAASAHLPAWEWFSLHNTGRNVKGLSSQRSSPPLRRHGPCRRVSFTERQQRSYYLLFPKCSSTHHPNGSEGMSSHHHTSLTLSFPCDTWGGGEVGADLDMMLSHLQICDVAKPGSPTRQQGLFPWTSKEQLLLHVPGSKEEKVGAMKTKTVKLEMELTPGFNFQPSAHLGKQREKESQGKHPEVPGSGTKR
ncbi:uncharacterized protein PRD47_017585 isoform 1-T1 [Ara ararauna]